MPRYIFYLTLPEEPSHGDLIELEADGFTIIDSLDPDLLWPIEKEIGNEKELAETESFLHDWAAEHDGTYEHHDDGVEPS